MVQAKEVIVVTGCSGRIGTRIARKFSDPRFCVVGLDDTAPKISTGNFEFIQTDITDDTSVKNASDRIHQKYGDTLAAWIHLSDYYEFASGSSQQYDAVNVQGTKRALLAASSFKTEQFLFASSMLVHAPCELGQKITERWPLQGLWDYPRSKIQAEECVQELHGQMPVVVLRIAECYDEGCHSATLSRQIQKIYERHPEASFFPGNLAHGSTYLHFDDLVDAIWLSVQRRHSLPNELTLLIGESDTVGYDEFQKVIGMLVNGKECATKSIPKWMAEAGVWMENNLPFLEKTSTSHLMIEIADFHYCLDVEAIKERLGWAPKHSIRQVLPKMIASLKEDPVSWYKENALQLPAQFEKDF